MKLVAAGAGELDTAEVLELELVAGGEHFCTPWAWELLVCGSASRSWLQQLTPRKH